MAMASYLDEAIGNVTNIFKKYKFWDNTVTVFTADNGRVGFRLGGKGGGADPWP